MVKMVDILLYPEKFFKNLNENILTLYIGILFIGFVDVISIFMKPSFDLFYGKPIQLIFFNLIGVILLLVILGFVDVIAFAMPLFDLFKHFRKFDDLSDFEENFEGDEVTFEESKVDEDVNLNTLLIKFMKVYIVAHFFVVAIELAFWLLANYSELSKAYWFNDAYQIFDEYIGRIWFAAIITRGVMVVLELNKRLTIMIFITIFSWNYLMAISLSFIYSALYSLIFKS